MAVFPRGAAILIALLLSMTSNSLSADAFVAAVPGNAAKTSRATAVNGASTAASPATETEAAAAASSNDQLQVPLLPASTSNDPSIPRIQLGGEGISFDHIGPIIINADGTTKTIDNWKDLSLQEQQTAWRRIAKRNEERRAALLIKQQEQTETDQVLEREIAEAEAAVKADQEL
ncbi:hypothetical protein MPSEU_000048200 [Mayamaea pseudoterrestris]|nr:hypothetical protein MPSEU_000048200 [Mayamaea pseudoterrestris]